MLNYPLVISVGSISIFQLIIFSQSALAKRWPIPLLNEMVLEQPTQQNIGEKDVGAAMKIELGDEEELFTAAEKIEEEHRPKRRKMARKHIEVAKGQQDNGEGSWRNNQEHRFHLNGDSFPTCTAEIGATTDLGRFNVLVA